MKTTVQNRIPFWHDIPAIFPLTNRTFTLFGLFWIGVYGLAIFQDFLFAQFRSTGFYWSETILYNIYWLLFIPSSGIIIIFYCNIRLKITIKNILIFLGAGLASCFVHIFLFAGIFTLLSNIFFVPPHRFSGVLESAVSNQWYLTIIAYYMIPLVIGYNKNIEQLRNSNPLPRYMITIMVKQGIRRIWIDVSCIQCITTNRPYSEIYTNDQKYLLDQTLKKLETRLNPDIFFKVHRSAIINKNHIKVLISRKNGDYDAVLTNGQSIRLSRHYRENWTEFIHH